MKKEYDFRNAKKNPYVTGLKSLLLCLILSISLFIFSACGGPPPISQEEIKADLIAQLKDDYPNIDTVTELEVEKSELTQADKDFITSKYENVDVAKYDVSFTMTSLSENVKGYCSLIYVTIEDKWSVADCYEINSDNWEYTPKDVKPSTQILEDLGDVKFDKFEQGYVGRNDNTEIAINSRKTELEKGTDAVDAVLTVKTSFSKYIINVKLNYVFEKGKWLLDSYNIAKESDWKVEYIDENMPKAISPETVFMQLTDEAYFLSYCINKNYLSSYTIEQISEDTDTSSVKFIYGLNAVYDNIGIFTYTITIPYEWNDQWQAKEIDVRITDLDISAMQKALWVSKDGTTLKFSNLKSSTVNAYTNPDVLVGEVVDKDDKKQNVELQVKPSKTDNDWEVIVTTDGSESDVKCSISLKDKTLVYNDVVFTAKTEKESDTQPSTTPKK